MNRTVLVAVAALSLAFQHQEASAQAKKPSAALTEKEAGKDFPFQGEYAGEVTSDGEQVKLGAHIVAMGNGKFQAVGYPGGLPGDGWTEDEKITAEGEREGDVVTVRAENGGSATVENGTMTIKDADGNAIGTLKKVVRKSKTLGAKPPEGAVVLFDGTTAKHFAGGKLTKEKLLEPGATSSRKFAGPFKLHMEFLLSFMPEATGQQRSNSGVYLQGRYEVQILDSFGLEGRNNECGAVYNVKAPSTNMCFPPLQWQTYDVEFQPAVFDAKGKKTSSARMTVWHNGVKIHDDVEVPDATRAAPVKEGPDAGPIYIQDHGNPLRFRNIWVVEKK